MKLGVRQWTTRTNHASRQNVLTTQNLGGSGLSRFAMLKQRMSFIMTKIKRLVSKTEDDGTNHNLLHKAVQAMINYEHEPAPKWNIFGDVDVHGAATNNPKDLNVKKATDVFPAKKSNYSIVDGSYDDPTGSLIGVPIQKFPRTTDYKRKETLRNFDKSQRPWKVITVEEYLATRSGYMPNKIAKTASVSNK